MKSQKFFQRSEEFLGSTVRKNGSVTALCCVMKRKEPTHIQTIYTIKPKQIVYVNIRLLSFDNSLIQVYTFLLNSKYVRVQRNFLPMLFYITNYYFSSKCASQKDVNTTCLFSKTASSRY